jgi:hypothetical protein
MVITESVIIHAPVKKVWDAFVTFTCWADWNKVLVDVTSRTSCLAAGEGFSCCIRPYFLPVYFSPQVISVEPQRKIVWTVSRFGISSVHEFLFEERPEGMAMISRETFTGLPVALGAGFFFRKKVRRLTLSFLDGLRTAAGA